VNTYQMARPAHIR